MKILQLNLAKRMDKAQRALISQINPAVCLLQEYWRIPDDLSNGYQLAMATSYVKRGDPVGAAILYKATERRPLVKEFRCEDAEAVIGIKKTTVLVDFGDYTLVSIHGHNGWPFKKAEPLCKQVETVLKAVNPNRPCLFAGDFNTSTEGRMTQIRDLMKKYGYTHAYQAHYSGHRYLDHVFTRGVNASNFEIIPGYSDHPGLSYRIG
jgi:endonuclease/exonuclease/phosphatase (EEP) superfamily protein YafD